MQAAPRGLRRFVRRYLLPAGIEDALHRLLQSKELHFVLQLETKLWAGFSWRALRDLDAEKRRPDASALRVSAAAQALSSWYVSQGAYKDAHDNAVLMRVARPSLARTEIQALLETDCLTALGHPERARQILEDYRSHQPFPVALQLALANTYATPTGVVSLEAEAARLEMISRVLAGHGLAQLEVCDASRPLALDNLQATTVGCVVGRAEQPKISVLVPAYRAAQTMNVALDSLLCQTWHNLEIIVVDDHSGDGSFEVAERYAARDKRVIAIQQPRNRGAYAARNLALSHAGGAFVTVHDADDWSHPQKLEAQATHLLDNPNIPANASDWVRCLPHLYFRGRARASEPWVHLNYSSLMVRRDVLIKMGGWDEVRVGADSELMGRLKRECAGANLPRVKKGVPLSFARVSPDSLTQQSLTHAFTLHHGVRRTYHEAAQFWLGQRGRGDVALPLAEQGRAFPAPLPILPEAATEAFDVLFIGDLCHRGEGYQRMMKEIRAAIEQEQRAAVFHWQRYDLDVRMGLDSEVAQLAQDRSLYVLSAGEHVTVDTVVVCEPAILGEVIDRPPVVSCRCCSVRPTPADQAFRERVAANVYSLCGKRPVWGSQPG